MAQCLVLVRLNTYGPQANNSLMQSFTMFCPTDEAFTKLYAAINTTEDELMASNILPALMLHHLVLDTAPKLMGRVAPLELETSLGDTLHVTFPE
jgi:hypothetical protein